MRQTLRRILALLPLLAVCLQGSWAQGVNYFYHAWEHDPSLGKYRVFNYGSICNVYKVLDSSTHTDGGNFGVGDNPEWDNGGYKWVVVRGEVNIKTLIVIGEGHLILTDGCKLTCTGGVKIEGSNTLYIYGQTGQTGQLIANNTENSGQAGIGCAGNASSWGMGTLVVHGGKISCQGPSGAAGIGGGKNRGIKGTLTIYGGEVTAQGGKNAAGIGGGDDGSQGGEIVIYGGIVKAQGGDNGAGIGGGDGECGGHVVVEGSTADVTATGGKNAAGIGGGNSGDASDWANNELLTVNDGKVTAIGGVDGAGIGAGWRTLNEWKGTHHCNGGVVTVNGGEVTAQGGYHAAGIGLGGNYTIAPNDDADYGTLTVTGGTVKATGGESGAGIGGGNRSRFYRKEKSKCTISGGTVIAQGGKFAAGIGGGNNSPVQSVIISGGTVTATGGRLAPGIGAGKPQDNSLSSISYVTISGGKVTATGGSGGGAGIGGAKYYGQSSIFPIKISGGEVKAEGSTDGGAGIGAGCETGNCGEFSFTGGTIISIAHGDWVGGAIGWGKEGDPCSIQIGAGLRVSNGTTVESLTPVEAGQRSAACHDASKLVAKLEVCSDHSSPNADAYTYVSASQHRVYCMYCNETATQDHDFSANVCTKCGYQKEAEETVWLRNVTLHMRSAVSNSEYNYDKVTNYVVGDGKNFTLPEGDKADGLIFMGWDESEPSSPGSYDYLLGDNEIPAHQPGYVISNITSNQNLYARYILDVKSEEWTWDTSGTTPTAKVKLNMGGSITTFDAANGVAVTHTDHKEATADEAGYDTYKAEFTRKFENRRDYKFSDELTIPIYYHHDLPDQPETETVIEGNDKRGASVTLQDITLYKDGHWNTLCLPFNVTLSNPVLAGDGVQAKLLDAGSSNLTDGTLTLNFNDVAADDLISAGTPFIIKWNTASDIVAPEFENIVIQSDLNGEYFGTCRFEGTFAPFSITQENINEIIYLSTDNQLGYAAEPRTLHAFRAHFVAPVNADGTRSMTRGIINYGDGTTDIISIRDGITEKVSSARDGWYDLQGRRLNSTPQRKGIYIHNGKKTVIK